VLCAAPFASPAWAGAFDGEWIGAFQGKDDWVFLQVRLGGEGKDMTGRADLPMNGEEAILLQNVGANDRRVTFELPGAQGNLLFEGELREGGRVTGSVRQGFAWSSFELLRTHTVARETLRSLAGDYEAGGPEDVILVHTTQNGLAYVDYPTGRVGRLFAVGEDRFVSGPNVLSGFPVELSVSFRRNEAGQVVGSTWERKGEPAREAQRRTFYRMEPLRLRSSDNAYLAASLLVPNGRGPHPAVVMIPGTGRVTRDALMPFADSFARHGVAVLIGDKRGIGESTGSYARAGITELADDAEAGVEWLKKHPAINGSQIGLVGTSLGGWVAPLVATRSPDVKFIIVEAAPAITPAEHERLRVQNQMRADDQSRRNIVLALAFMDRKFKVGRTGEGWEDLQALARKGEREGWARYVNLPGSLESLRWNWQHVLSYDPQPVLRQLRVPVLALYGELDRIVEPRFNRERMEKALEAAGNRDITVRVFPSANHNFLAAITGGPNEVPRLRAFVDGYFQARVDWLREHVDETVPVADTALAGTGGQDQPPIPPVLRP
jgi:dienelactone hydrolase